MTANIPTLEELAEVTGQDIEQLRRDAQAAAEPRVDTSESSELAADT